MIEGDKVGDNSRKFTAFRWGSCDLRREVDALITRDCGRYTTWETHFLAVSLPLWGHPPCSRKRLPPIWKTHNNRAYGSPRLSGSSVTSILNMLWWWRDTKTKRGVCWGVGGTKGRSWVSTTPTGHLIYSHCLLTLISLIHEQTAALFQGYQDDRTLAPRGHSCGSRWLPLRVHRLEICRSLCVEAAGAFQTQREALTVEEIPFSWDERAN